MTTHLEAISEPIDHLNGECVAPRDKSISHRALILGATALGETMITGLLEAEDVLSTWKALEHLGVSIKRKGEQVSVLGCGIGGLAPPETVLNCGNSGTTARLLCGLLSAHPFQSMMTGDASLRARPMTRITHLLEPLGANFQTTKGKLPMVIQGAEMPIPLDCRMEVPSAQIKTGLLLAGMTSPGISRIVVNIPTRDHTERLLRFFGVSLKTQNTSHGTILDIEGQKDFWGRSIVIPGDPSSSAFMMGVAACLVGSKIMIRDVCINPHRIGFARMLESMGASIIKHDIRTESGEPCCDYEIVHPQERHSKKSPLKGVHVPAKMAPSMIDEYPMMAVVAACAQGTTTLEGLTELKHKESNRLSGILAMLKNNGVEVFAKDDSLKIKGHGGRPPGGGTVVCAKDHRLAMAGLALGCVSRKPVKVDDAGAIATSFPSFLSDMKTLGAKIVQQISA